MRHIKENRKHLDTGRKGGIARGADPAFTGGRLRVKTDLSDREGFLPEEIKARNPGWAP